MFCRFCGTENPDGAVICANCNNELISAVQPTVAEAQPVAQPVYQPVYQPVQMYAQPEDETVSFGDWFLSIFLMRIPLVNLIITLVFAFSSGTKKSKSNFFKAKLVWMLISTVLSILAGVFMFVFGYEIIEELLWELGLYW